MLIGYKEGREASLDLPCPVCLVLPGEECVSRGGVPTAMHRLRCRGREEAPGPPVLTRALRRALLQLQDGPLRCVPQKTRDTLHKAGVVDHYGRATPLARALLLLSVEQLRDVVESLRQRSSDPRVQDACFSLLAYPRVLAWFAAIVSLPRDGLLQAMAEGPAPAQDRVLTGKTITEREIREFQSSVDGDDEWAVSERQVCDQALGMGQVPPSEVRQARAKVARMITARR